MLVLHREDEEVSSDGDQFVIPSIQLQDAEATTSGSLSTGTQLEAILCRKWRTDSDRIGLLGLAYLQTDECLAVPDAWSLTQLLT